MYCTLGPTTLLIILGISIGCNSCEKEYATAPNYKVAVNCLLQFFRNIILIRHIHNLNRIWV